MQIKTVTRSWDATCTMSNNLTQNQVKMPEIREAIMYAEPRMLTTLLVSGAKAPWHTVTGTNEVKTKIGEIPKGRLIGDVAYRYRIMGRIQQKTVINAQVGTSGTDGTFSLSLRDNYVYPGMNVVFYDQAVQARVMGNPTGGPNNYVYAFQTVDGSVFDYANTVTPQNGEKTLFGAFTTYGERSLRGYGRTHYPEEFVNHLGIQRKSIAMSGSALTDVIWTYFNGSKGWFFQKEQQARLQFMMEDEHSKMFSRSTMRDSNGDLRTTPSLYDEKGDPIYVGDGLLPQYEGENEAWGSGTDGYATLDDFRDMMRRLKRKSTAIKGNRWGVICGASAYGNAQTVLADYWLTSLGGRFMQSQSNKVGGADMEVGANFDTLNFEGDQLTFVQHPFLGDEERWAARASDGDLIQDGMYIFCDMGMNEDGRQNIEILGKGAYGINRTNVSFYLNGATGANYTPYNSVDALEFNMLKEDGIFTYNTSSCGILRRTLV